MLAEFWANMVGNIRNVIAGFPPRKGIQVIRNENKVTNLTDAASSTNGGSLGSRGCYQGLNKLYRQMNN